jgi:DNA-binding transcriptional LysR family regulator
MFAKLFAEGGLSLDRLRALLEVSAAGSIVKAAGGDPVRQSQFSRQIKELEDFFSTRLLERHGRGIRLTVHGRELARISRFFLLGLSNFRRGCRQDQQTFRIGVSPTIAGEFVVPLLATAGAAQASPRYAVEICGDDAIEARLHDLTLDFGVVTQPVVSRPLQVKALGRWALILWLPRTLCRDVRAGLAELKARRLPLAITTELPAPEVLVDYPPRLVCGSFAELRRALRARTFAALLPEFLPPDSPPDFFRVPSPWPQLRSVEYRFAWNPRLLRLNPHAARVRDFLVPALTHAVQEQRPPLHASKR